MNANLKQTNTISEETQNGLTCVTVDNDLKLYEELAHVLLENQKRVSRVSTISTMLMAMAVVADHDPQVEPFIVDAYRYYCEKAREDDNQEPGF